MEMLNRAIEDASDFSGMMKKLTEQERETAQAIRDGAPQFNGNREQRRAQQKDFRKSQTEALRAARR